MSKIMELRNKRNTLWEQTKNFLEEHRGFRSLRCGDGRKPGADFPDRDANGA